MPDEPLPLMSGTFNVPLYGMNKWGDLFTARQKVFLQNLDTRIEAIGKADPNNSALAEAATMVVGITATYGTASGWWHRPGEKMGPIFGRPALPIVWDFAEVNPFIEATGGYSGALEWVTRVIETTASSNLKPGQVSQADACSSPLPNEAVAVWFTDPPYYDAVPYADLSDFFFVWLKRTLPDHPLLYDPFNPENPLVPKTREAVQNERSLTEDGRSKDRNFYEEAMARAFAEGRRLLHEDGVGSVVFAHKTTEGWEALLSGMIRAGWTITGSWPIATEMGSRLRARDSAALATSVHLVCRPRPSDAPVGDWGEVLRELPRRVASWMKRLQGEGIRGADLVFACIGPALEVFSRYCKVETADGREVKLAEFLEKVWEVVGRVALEQILGGGSGFQPDITGKIPVPLQGGLEEDARLTALFLWTLQATNGNSSTAGTVEDAETEENDDEEDTAALGRAGKKTKGYSLVFDVVRRFAQPLGIDLPKWEGRIIETKKGIVRLMAVSERAKQLFGSAGIDSAVEELLAPAPGGQMMLPGFEEYSRQNRVKTRGRGQKVTIDDSSKIGAAATTLDRVHAAMLLQAAGQANALRELIRAEQQRGPDFLRLANALSALYPKESEEKRLLDAMLLAVPR